MLREHSFCRSLGPAILLAFLAGCGSPAPTVQRAVSLSAATCQQPTYPAEARRHDAAGTTEIEFEVNAEGKVTRVAIVGPSGTTPGHQALDSLALTTVSKCVFPPAPGFLSGKSKISYVWRIQD